MATECCCSTVWRSEAGTLLRSLVLPLYLPEVLKQLIYGILAAILPIYGKNYLHLSVSEIGLAQSMLSFGALFSSLPAGVIVSKLGVTKALCSSLTLIILALLFAKLWAKFGVLLVACLLLGIGDSIWGISRHCWVSFILPSNHRGIALSPLGGSNNVANFVGPILGGLIANYLEASFAFWIQMGLAFVVLLMVLFVPRKDERIQEEGEEKEEERGRENENESDRNSVEEREEEEDSKKEEEEDQMIELREEEKEEEKSQEPISQKLRNYLIFLWDSAKETVLLHVRIVKEHWWKLFSLGVFLFCLAVVRGSRLLIVPLVALNIGLSNTQVGIVTGLSFGINTLFCAVGGYSMDNHGRKPTAIIAITILGLAYLHLPFLPTMTGLIFAGLLSGIGNSFGSGLVLTLGADLSPKENRAEFLAIFRFSGNTGAAVGPLVLGLLMDYVSLGVACFVCVGTGIFGGLWIYFLFEETLVKKIEVIEEIEIGEVEEGEEEENAEKRKNRRIKKETRGGNDVRGREEEDESLSGENDDGGVGIYEILANVVEGGDEKEEKEEKEGPDSLI